MLGALLLVAVGLPVGLAVHNTLKAYRDVGALDVLGRMSVVQAVLALVGLVVAVCVVRVPLVLAYRSRPVFPPDSLEELFRQHDRAPLERHHAKVARFLPLAVGLFAAATLAGQWRKGALWWNATTFGAHDPVFGRDAGFYVFTLPWLRTLVGFTTMCFVLALLASLAAHVGYGGIVLRGVPGQGGARTTRAARVHLATLLAVIFMLRAASAIISRYELVASSGPRFGGMTYTAEHVVDPALTVSAVIAVGVAVWLIAVWRTDSMRLPLTGAAVFLVLSIVGLDVVVPLYDRTAVHPNAARLEQIRARQGMSAQAEAFSLDGVRQDVLSGGGLQATLGTAVRTAAEAATPRAVTVPPAGRHGISPAAAVGRAAKVAPWLRWDSNPYEVNADGRRLWLIDGYTSTESYPGSQVYRLGGAGEAATMGSGQGVPVNYVRDAVKATVDDRGRVVLYAWDPHDPILRAWQGLFPEHLEPSSRMPQDVRDQLRYPHDLFVVQRDVVARYHVRSAHDLLAASPWQPAADPDGQPVGTPAEVRLGPTSVEDGHTSDGLVGAFVSGGEASQLRGLLTGVSDASGQHLRLGALPDAGGDGLPDPFVWSKQWRASSQHEAGGQRKPADVVKEAERRGTVTFQPTRVMRVGTGVLYVQYVTALEGTKNATPRVIAVALRSGYATAWGTSAGRAVEELLGSSRAGSNQDRALDQVQQALDDANAAEAKGDAKAYRDAARRLQSALDAARKR